MKKTVKCMVALCFFFALFLCLPQRVSASEGTYQGLKYKVENGKVTIIGCTDSLSGKVTVPEKIEGYPVTKIGRAFYKKQNITSVVLPDTVTTIGEEAFGKCENLTSIYFGSGITRISHLSFDGCKNIKKVYISNLYAWCNAEIESYPMRYGADLYLNGEKVTDLVIPDGVSYIKQYTFEGCISIKSVTLPKSISSISAYAFKNCKNLKKVSGKDATIHIGSEAFMNCKSLAEISVKGIDGSGSNAFKNCTALKRVEISDIDAWCRGSFASQQGHPLYYTKTLYVNGEVLTEVKFPDDVKEIRNNVFYNCTTLKTVILPEKITKIGDNAFQNCTALTEVAIQNIRPTICDDAFSGCKSLQSVRYRGTEEDRKQMGIGIGNKYLTDAVWEYFVHDHIYDNACDADCNICQENRIPDEHKYAYACTECCSVCKEKRTAEPHTYSNPCDGDCNVCAAKRWYGEPDHFYDSECDTECNSCAKKRRVPHSYDGDWDDKCNLCSAKRKLASGQKKTEEMWLIVSGRLWGVPLVTLFLALPPVVIAIILLCSLTTGLVAMYIVWRIDKKKLG